MRQTWWCIPTIAALLAMCNQSTDPAGSGGGDQYGGEAVVFVRVDHCTKPDYDNCTVSPTVCRCPDFRGYSCEAILAAVVNDNGHPVGRYYVLDHTSAVLDSNAIGVHTEVKVPSGSPVTVQMLAKNQTTGAIERITDQITATDSLRWDFFHDTWSTEGVPGPCDTAGVW